MNNLFHRFRILTKNSDLGIALGLVLVLCVMIVPITPFLMDLLISLTIAGSMVILLMAVYAHRPLDFSTFPSILLMGTLFRLSLNVASTRNILIRGGSEGSSAAGEIIRSFGDYVVGGNFAVGIIIFIILVIINFIVITKGAGRVAEVAARFTLDAMPGKQMAIDADLNAGLINEQQARTRRQEISNEADFYGSMDGASKFVRGDAIAGILITIVNIIGGIIVGMAQNDMSFSQATELFTLLTIGDGLVAQIPALIISTAAGIIATRNSSEFSLGAQLSQQFRIHPKALYIVSAILVLFSLIPGLPTPPFFIIALLLAFTGYRMEMTNKEEAADKKKLEIEEVEGQDEKIEDLLPLELVELEVGYGLVHIVDADQNGDLLERISHIRKQFALDWGIIVPSVRIKDNLEFQPGSYALKIKGIEVAKGELLPDHLLAMDPGSIIEPIDGVETVEPVFGLNAVWISEEKKEEAQYNGYTVVDLSTIIATHFTEVLKTNLADLFGRQELSSILENFKEKYPKIVDDLIPDILPLGTILKVMQNLLQENVSVRDIRTILETLAERGMKIKDPDRLTEYTRQALYRTITERIKNDDGEIPLFTVDRVIEDHISQNLIQSEEGTHFGIDAKMTQQILSGLNQNIEEATRLGEKMVVLCSPNIRRHFKKLTEKFLPQLIVISHNELSPETHIKSLGTVRL